MSQPSGKGLAAIVAVVALLIFALFVKDHYSEMLQWSQFEKAVAALTALTALFVMVFTGILAWMAVSQEDSKRAIERAYLFVSVHPTKESPISRNLPESTNVADFPASLRILNAGKTPAVFTKFRAVLVHTLESRLHSLPETIVDRGVPAGVAVAGNNGTSNYPLPLFATDEEVSEIRAGTRKLFCCGVISYNDMFDTAHETGFCWEYHSARNIFKIADNHKLNYQT